MATWQGLKGGSDIWLTIWTKEQDKEANFGYFWIYAALGLGSSVFIYFRVLLLTRGALKLSNRLHEEMISRLIDAPINLYHDTTPKGQILNRLSKDLGALDTYMVYMYGNFYVYLCAMLGSIVICAIYTPWCLLVLPIVCFFGFITLRFYISASRDLSRLEGIVRSPLLNQLSETINGSVTIRAYQHEDQFIKTFCSKSNEFFKVRIFMNGVSNWFNLVLDFFTIIFFMFFILTSIILQDYFQAASIGIVLSYSIQLQDYLLKFLTSLSSLENGMVSLERCAKYTEIIQEKPKILPEDSNLPMNWPNFGKIEFVNYSVKYRPETNLVLKNINLTFFPGQKIGVVGRTGSGKSTLCLALFRILEPEIGTIKIDEIDITKIGLKTLRKNLTIIPQDPILMEGTLKYNIDPLKLYSNEKIIEMINMIGFAYLIESHPLGLEMPVNSNLI
jgi:ABC-type multidrug transport system fused ATPase/permease subunit